MTESPERLGHLQDTLALIGGKDTPTCAAASTVLTRLGLGVARGCKMSCLKKGLVADRRAALTAMLPRPQRPRYERPRRLLWFTKRPSQ